MTKLFPSILIALSVCASGVYLWDGDWRKATYWAAAATMNIVITF